MPDEELSMVDGEEPAPPSRMRPAWWVVLALVLVAIGSIVVGRNNLVASSSAPAYNEQTFDAVAARPLPTTGLSLGLGENLSIGISCPTVAGAPGTIAVSFRLVNWGQSNVVITGLAVSGSSHGLRATESSAGGSCEQPAHGPVGGALVPGDSKLYTLWFRAPAGCPASAKTVSLGVHTDSLTGTTTKAVGRDVGQVYLSTCPASPATP